MSLLIFVIVPSTPERAPGVMGSVLLRAKHTDPPPSLIDYYLRSREAILYVFDNFRHWRQKNSRDRFGYFMLQSSADLALAGAKHSPDQRSDYLEVSNKVPLG